MSNSGSSSKKPSDSAEKPSNRDSGFSTLSVPYILPQETIAVAASMEQSSKPPIPRQAPVYSTPAPTTSDVHSPAYEHDEHESEDEKSLQQKCLASPMLGRFLTVNPEDSSLKYESLIAISQGRVQNGENMLERRIREMEELDEARTKRD
jgi:hypothetical protein